MLFFNALFSIFQIFLSPGLVVHPYYFQGLVFQFLLVDSPNISPGKRHKRQSLAIGGRYDKLLETLRNISQSIYGGVPNPGGGGGGGTGSSANSSGVCGVSISEDVLMRSLCNAINDGKVCRVNNQMS